MAFEERQENCWKCKYFIQLNETTNQGLCARKAPTKTDQIIGNASGKVYPALSHFQSMSDGPLTFCGQFALLPGVIPPIPVAT